MSARTTKKPELALLIASAAAMKGLALGRLVDRRFRLLTLGALGYLAARALSSFAFEDDERPGLPPVASLGVPHRIPEEALLPRLRERPGAAKGAS